MKKSLFIIALTSALLLSGCFGKKDAQKPAAEEAPNAQTISGEPQAKSEETPPSFQDGDIYLKALATQSLEMCGMIKNASLKTKCEGKVKATKK